MATCKDCIHYEACDNADLSEYVSEEEMKVSCPHFKNKADFVEVVRCKNCKHRYSYQEFDRNTQETYECSGCHMLHKDLGDNNFCSYGERK